MSRLFNNSPVPERLLEKPTTVRFWWPHNWFVALVWHNEIFSPPRTFRAQHIVFQGTYKPVPYVFVSNQFCYNIITLSFWRTNYLFLSFHCLTDLAVPKCWFKMCILSYYITHLTHVHCLPFWWCKLWFICKCIWGQIPQIPQIGLNSLIQFLQKLLASVNGSIDTLSWGKKAEYGTFIANQVRQMGLFWNCLNLSNISIRLRAHRNCLEKVSNI